MNKIAIAVHGGASENYPFLQKYQKDVERGLIDALEKGYALLNQGGMALDAVEEAVKTLENNSLFNAGKGSALNCHGEVEMDASIMSGTNLQAGAVSMVRTVKNPIHLARIVMEHTHHVFLSGYGALEIAKKYNLELESESYFITPHQYEMYQQHNAIETMDVIQNKKMTGTVGAVALDSHGNLAAGTSTGGTSNCLPGRIGDSCVIGAGCYANNNTCAVSGTGVGEYLIRNVVGHTISMMVEFNMSLQQACDYVIHERNKELNGEMGVIALNRNGDFGISFNTEIMKRAWKSSEQKTKVKIFD
ncbi:isoaspartyl peptidase/L-asparaginase family protein [Legionella longbeachae]|uniref:Isoaspartyl peptidase n=1 Tax=Legionella longbeachae serogroup 1 (strain NSW150) TaxID=661367 RepID=D3HKJ1_LEGLN|nr:isoaspartyl peptidase/L-asparaginase [Legionella longbeachae]VEE03472.1 isoaspartyl dipeptidase with L-asparaginase activity [Legionella oakridgensis]HBD7397750.1 isoaspartyl peptidase/L-asparaginase [Legionella pneumophila]ARB93635.1 isoaspartyl peptidase/L-asparaginase [Legionella longbeachae]ARM33224.1 isoaspartyl peptidase/L-asparaginase [Legionella longbeachae]EEZ93917.1 putative asparaginase [Legionella longbeachae D-4968]